jgi:phospholipase C
MAARPGRLSRRQFLGGAAGVGVAGMASSLSWLVDRAYAAADPAGCGSLSDIEHFVFVMQENRSFDHYFGTLSGVKGFDDPAVLTQQVGGQTYPVWNQFGYQPGVGATATGFTLPFELAEDSGHDGQWLNDPTHNWGPQHQCWNGGAMDSFIRTHVASDGPANGPIVMSHYNRLTLPFYYALADAFTVCDSYFCSVIGPTYPNRLYWMSGTIDPGGTAGGPLLETLAPVADLAYYGKFGWTTMPEVLEQAGISWKVYQSPDTIYGASTPLLIDNVLRYFKAYTDPATSIAQKAFVPTYPGTFEVDVASGQLPQVSWVITQFLESEHPAAPPDWGSYAIADILQTLISNPAVWEKTALILSYDENGGFFDHVPPPTPPAGTPGEYITAPLGPIPDAAGIAGPIGLGFRVPCLVLSPYSRGGMVYSGLSDHTSQLRLLETRFGVPVPNLSAWRRQIVGDLTGAFDFAQPPQPSVPALPATTLADPLVIAQGLQNGTGASLGSGIPYPIPPNAVQHQESGSRRQPSGIVCAVAAGTTTTTAVTPATPNAGNTSATDGTPAGAGTTSAGSEGRTLADSGMNLDETLAAAAALMILGSVATGLAHRNEPPATPDGPPTHDQLTDAPTGWRPMCRIAPPGSRVFGPGALAQQPPQTRRTVPPWRCHGPATPLGPSSCRRAGASR